MNTTQIYPSVDSHTEEPLWQELTEDEQEKIAGGGWGHKVQYGKWQLWQKGIQKRQVIYTRFGLMYNWRVQSRYWHNGKWNYFWSGNRQSL